MRSLTEIIDALGDRVLRVKGDPSRDVAGFTAAAPGRSGWISFVTGRDESVSEAVMRSQTDTFFIPPGTSQGLACDKVLIEVPRPRLEFARVASLLFPPPTIDDSPGVDAGAEIGESTRVGPGVIIEKGVRIGADCLIGPNVVLRSGTVIGDRVRVAPGCVIGEQGFGFERDEDGRAIRLPHYGGVHIGDDVEIGSNTVIDKGVFVNTTICVGVKIDSQVLIGHNVVVHRDSLVTGGVVLCGGVQVGHRTWLAPSAVVMEQVTIGNESVVGIGAAVCRNVGDGDTVTGVPARPALRIG